MSFRPKYFTDIQKVAKIVNRIQLKPVKSITYSFDPFQKGCESIREVLQALSIKKIKLTSPVPTKIDVKSDRSEPQMDVMFNDGHKLIFKTKHLLPSEIVGKIDEFCKERDTSVPESDIALTKMSGKPGGKKKKK